MNKHNISVARANLFMLGLLLSNIIIFCIKLLVQRMISRVIVNLFGVGIGNTRAILRCNKIYAGNNCAVIGLAFNALLIYNLD